MKKLFLTLDQRLLMEQQVQTWLPEEACGMGGGKSERLEEIYPITNSLHSPVRFQMDPHEMLQAFELIESNGYELLAIYHSHPHGPPMPSETDLANFFYPGVAYLIWYPEGTGWKMRGFEIEDGQTTELELVFGVTTDIDMEDSDVD